MTKDNFARALVVWFLTSIGIFLTGVLTGFYARNLVAALIATAGLGLINAMLWPLLSRLALARSVITFGFQKDEGARKKGNRGQGQTRLHLSGDRRVG